MKISEITLNPQVIIPGDPLRFRIGTEIVEGGHIVEKITYCPKTGLFNKGREIGGGCYAVFLEGIPERRLIAEDAVTTVEVAKEVKSLTLTEAAIDLPE